MGSEEQEEEGEIPVLSVLKNNTLLKNIFIVNNKEKQQQSRGSDHVDELIVGRHPDCDLTLTHPSISRFHLQIRSAPSLRRFSVVDLSSVHGTWVSGRRIEPMVSVEMKEGDALRIGVSSRVYRLHWIPVSRAYDLENPFVAQLDTVAEEEEEEVVEQDKTQVRYHSLMRMRMSLEVHEHEEGKKQFPLRNLNCSPAEMKNTESMDSIIEDISSLFPCENSELALEEDIPLAPWMLKNMVSLCCEEERKGPSKVEAVGRIQSELQNLNCSPAEMENTESMDSIIEDISSLFLCENAELALEEDIPLAPWMLKNMVSLSCEEERKSPSKVEAVGRIQSEPFGIKTSPMMYDGENIMCDSWSQVLSPPPYVESIVGCVERLAECLSTTSCFPAAEAVLETEMQFHSPPDTFASPLLLDHENLFEKHRSSLLVNTAPSSLDEKSAAEAVIMPKETECESECTLRDDESVIDAFTVPSSLDEKSAAEAVTMPRESESGLESECILGDAGSMVDAFTVGAGTLNSANLFVPVEKVTMDSLSDEEKEDIYRSQSALLNDKFSHDQGRSLKEIVQDVGNKCTRSVSPIQNQTESVKLSIPQEPLLTNTNEKQTLQSDTEFLESCVKAMKKPSTNHNIWSRRGKAARAPHLRTSKDIINKTMSKNLFSVLDGEVEEEIFTPDKENFSPNTLQMRFLKGKAEEIQHSMSHRSRCLSKGTFNSEIHRNESIGPTLCKTNQNDTKNIVSKDLISILDGDKEEEEIFTPDKENFSPNSLQLCLLKKKGTVEEIKRSKSQKSSPLSKVTFNPDTYPKEDTGSTISENLFSDFDGEEEEEMLTPDKENISPNTLQLQLLKKKGKVEEIKRSKSQRSPLSKSTFNPELYPNEVAGPTFCKINQKDIINRTISKDLFSDLDGEEEEEELYTPDKENFSPNTLQLLLLKKKGKVEEIKHSKSPWPQNSKDNFGSDENMSKENQTPKVAHDKKLQRKPFSSHMKLAQDQESMTFKNRVDRVPFQSLKNSGGKRRSSTFFCPVSAAKSFPFNNCGQILDQPINPSDISGVPKRSSWDMIVDTTSLMNKESRKALQLLQGLKGTRLIIPRLVFRELDSMKRQFSIFRRISEASLALEWIEECMVKTNWWIHIQSSVDEGRMIAPTPPASPQTRFSEECWTSLASQKCSMEIASPTVEDHVLDFALLYRKNQNDGQLVLLSEDVTLKIKCMAEGLLCEPVEEFRESLVNPFSERFLWTNSSPRGQTWSCQDDVVLREKYCRLPLWKSSKGVASGLKLILLHNSQYGL
ncbi:hypothetical protein Fmac_016243 [Flemingia macrophylla]|uniref:FHA domain-containing protein n=1 Tax=Flemingia macrophylla TaxID=520843 RepID=A0ABD1MIZ7_9FABA